VQRLAAATPNSLVLGRPIPRHSHPVMPANAGFHDLSTPTQTGTFPGIPYHPTPNTLALITTLRRLNPTYIDVHQQPRLAILLSYALPSAKILLFLHNDPLTMRGLKTRFGRRLAVRRLHRVVCVSTYLRDRYMTGLTGPAPALLHNPLTLAELPPPATERAQSILFAGRIVADKGPDVFINACRVALERLPGWTATMMGGDRFGPRSPETPYVADMRRAAAAAGIEFLGPRPHGDILVAMARAAIVVIPSRWPEPFGLAALEAAASGAFIIATRQGGLPEAAGPAALYIEADNPAKLATAIITVAEMGDHRTSRAAAGPAWAKQFDTPVIAAALENLRTKV